jgi:diguanylate cyclase (GGDEF)-like protein
MPPSADALSTQQLAEFLAVVSSVSDGLAATRQATEGAARALEAEVAAVLGRSGVVSSVGYPAGKVPVQELTEVVAGQRSMLDVPGAGVCRTAVASFGGRAPGHLLVARSGGDGFTVEEVSLVRAMARVLELTLGMLFTLESERRQAAENSRLLASLQERHRLLQQLSNIQQAITRRAPLQSILDTITAGAQELLGDEAVGLRLRDPDNPQMLLLVSSKGLREDLARRLWRTTIAEAGAGGQAVLRDELVVMTPYASSPHNIPELVDARMQSVMAAPVHENSMVVGSLIVASYRSDRVYTASDQEVLRAFAEHVSLAVTDARTQEAMFQAYHDSLTGLASRGLFMDRLEHALAVTPPQQGRLAVLFVDLDRFKLVNDSRGHAVGDMLLIGVADRLRSCLRSTDTAARFGGDEFAIVLHDITQVEQAVVVAKNIMSELKAPFVINGRELFVSASIGVAFDSPGQRSAETLIRNADLAMYQAKNNGKARYEVFQPAMQRTLMRNLDLEADLRRAVERGEFLLHYQPIVELEGRRVKGVEALVRWLHPEHGLMPPVKFIPLAEETGLVVQIGEWVLREACRQVGAWNALRDGQPPLTVSVNLSARQLQQSGFPALVRAALDQTGLHPSSLVLEITESLLLHDTEATMRRLQRLKGLDVRLAIDDFGTGYSSLAYLRRFPIDILKIDKSFVDEVLNGPEASAVARAIVQLGTTLRLDTIAEGIEAAGQLAELLASGCRLGQGYFFGKPLERDEIAPLLVDTDGAD